MHTGIVIYEDNDDLRESLGNLITFSDRLCLMGSFSNVMNVEEQVKHLEPDVILMDIDLPGMNGIDAVKRIRTFNEKVFIIMLTIFDDSPHVLNAIISGASGYLLKKYISDGLPGAINDVLAGEAPMSPGIARMVIQHLYEKKISKLNKYNLTNREIEILRSLSEANSYKMIAAQHAISIDTVRTHIKKIYEKLQVHSQLEAVSKAKGEKLV
jgi:DNA-binding NarL/FixJ family response regulator